MKKLETFERYAMVPCAKAAAWAIAEGYRRGIIRGVDLVPEFFKLLRWLRDRDKNNGV